MSPSDYLRLVVVTCLVLWFYIFFVAGILPGFGFLLVAFLASLPLFDEEHAPGHGGDSSQDRAIHRLRVRYADGELTDEEFQEKLDALEQSRPSDAPTTDGGRDAD